MHHPLDNFQETLGTALARLRSKAGKKQCDIADTAGMPRSQISRYESGRDTPSLTTLVRYLKAADASLHDLATILEGPREPSTSTIVRMLRGGQADAIIGKAIKDLVLMALSNMTGEK